MLLRACVLLALMHASPVTSSTGAEWFGRLATTTDLGGAERCALGSHRSCQARYEGAAGDVGPGHSSPREAVFAATKIQSGSPKKTCWPQGTGRTCAINLTSDGAGPQHRRGGDLELLRNQIALASSAEPHALKANKAPLRLLVSNHSVASSHLARSSTHEATALNSQLARAPCKLPVQRATPRVTQRRAQQQLEQSRGDCTWPPARMRRALPARCTAAPAPRAPQSRKVPQHSTPGRTQLAHSVPQHEFHTGE